MEHCIFLAYSVGDSSVSRFFSQLAIQLSKKYTVVIFSDKKNELPFVSEKVILLYWPSPRPTKFKDFLFLRKAIRCYRPKLMLSTFGANNLFLVGGFFGRVPHRLATHRTISSHFKSSKFKLFRKKWVFKLATKIITNSGATRDDVIATFGVGPNKVHVVYNAVVDPQIRNERDPNLVVYAGRLTVNKGIDVLLEAFKMVSEKIPLLKLKVLGGTSSEVRNYQDRVVSLGLQPMVTLEGSLSGEMVLRAFSKACYVVVPSLSEGFGFVAIEAFSVRTPVIASNTGGLKEIVRHEVDGLLCEPGHPEALAKALIAMHGDHEKMTSYGENAYQRFLNTFELHHVVNELSTYLSTQINDPDV